MHVLVVATPKHAIPPDQIGPVTDGALAWYERYQDRFKAFGVFAGGGGFGALDVADEKELNQMLIEMPFIWFSDVEVKPYVEGAEGFQQLKQAVEAMAAMA